MAAKVDRTEAAYRVMTSFLDFEPGSIITRKDAPTADFPWLESVGTIKPLFAGPIAMRSLSDSGDAGREALDAIESLTEELEDIHEKFSRANREIQARETRIKAMEDRLNTVGTNLEIVGNERDRLKASVMEARGGDDYLAEAHKEIDRLLKENVTLRMELGKRNVTVPTIG